MKKIISIFCIFLLLFSVPTVAKASETNNNQIDVTLKNIREFITSNNTDLKIAENNIKKLQEEYNDLKDEIDELEDEISDTENSISSCALDDTESLTSLKSELNSYENQKESLEEQVDSKKYNLKVSKYNYQIKVENTLSKVQKSYLDYIKLAINTSDIQNEVNTNENANKIASLKYESGFLSKKDYNSALINDTELKNKLKQAQDSEDIARQNLCLSLGINIDSNINWTLDLDSDLSDIANIDFESDMDEMLQNNMDLKLQNMEIDRLNDEDGNDYDIENKELSLDDSETNYKIKFKEEYDNLMNSYNTLKTDYQNFNQLKEDNSAIIIGYENGFKSKSELDTSNRNLLSKTNAFLLEENTFYYDYMQYLQMKEGY
ncbi:TolC family protein [Clostridium sp. BJN0001]|uniref:TolC family protein n=1 Tax=Clostridium sp. BJN0001 TaxID=2930219 RepID=UPI001FD01DC5|nr:TolC family protein [Clostridium sp. BJN0001]